MESALRDVLAKATVVTKPMNLEELMEHPVDDVSIVLASVNIHVNVVELAQLLRMNYQNAAIFACITEREGFDRKNFIKNGFNDIFVIPFDITTAKTRIEDELAAVSEGAIKSYRTVKIIDVEPGVELEFDTSVFLAANNKYIKISSAGESLDQQRVEKIRNSKLNNIYVPTTQMPKFYQYSAKKLHSINSSLMSETEKREKMQTAVRELMAGMFTDQSSSFETGQSIMKDCNEIIKSYITSTPNAEWYQKLQQLLGTRGDTYSHASNTSTIAAMFSMGLGVGKPEDLALGGLLHDIGIAELPIEIQTKELHEMTKDERDQYIRHPELSIELIKKKKIVVPEIVTKMILQHHERFNGTGYPKGFAGDRICKEAQVLALADDFDEMTKLVEGRPLMSPKQVIDYFCAIQADDPSKIIYNPELLVKLKSLFNT